MSTKPMPSPTVSEETDIQKPVGKWVYDRIEGQEAAAIIDAFNTHTAGMNVALKDAGDRTIKYAIRDIEGVPRCVILNDKDPTHSKFFAVSEKVDDAFLDGWYKVVLKGTSLMFNYTTFENAWHWSREVESYMACCVSMEAVHLDIRVVIPNMTPETEEQLSELQRGNDFPVHYMTAAFWFKEEADAVSFKIGYDEVMR